VHLSSYTSHSAASRLAAVIGLAAMAACGDRSTTAPSVTRELNANVEASSNRTYGDPRGAGAVFVSTNSATENAVVAFRRDVDGHLTSLGTFATGGRGIGGTADPLASQFALTLSTDHRLLFVVNAGTNDVSVFRVESDGLELLGRTSSGGVRPVSVASSEHALYVLNAGDNTIGIFHVGDDGSLSARGTRALSAGAAGGAAIRVSPGGRVLAVTERVSNTIDGFVIRYDGSLGEPITTASTGAGPFGFDYTPGGELVVSDAGGAATSAYFQNRAGEVSAVGGAVSNDGQAAPCWAIVDGGGRFAYIANAGSGSISGYAIAPNGRLSLITPGGRTGDLGPGGAPLDLDLSRDGRFLFVLDNGTGTVGTFAVHQDGTLTGLPKTPGLAANAGFMGLAAF
jgi:6-phosphogluconolactonase